jgi:hypothetical protein
MMWLVFGSIRYRVVPRWLGTQTDPNPAVIAAGASPALVGIDANTPFGSFGSLAGEGRLEVGTDA